jgi:hypothetical protein
MRFLQCLEVPNRSLVDSISAQQIRVVGEIAQEPAEFPQGSGSGIEPSGK